MGWSQLRLEIFINTFSKILTCSFIGITSRNLWLSIIKCFIPWDAENFNVAAFISPGVFADAGGLAEVK